MKFHITIQEPDMHLAMVHNPSTIGVSVITGVVFEGSLQGYTGYKLSLNINTPLKLKIYSEFK